MTSYKQSLSFQLLAVLHAHYDISRPLEVAYNLSVPTLLLLPPSMRLSNFVITIGISDDLKLVSILTIGYNF